MVRVKRAELAADARRINREQLSRAGGELKRWRLRRRWTQAELGRRAGVSRVLVARLEHGDGGGVTVDGWQRVTLALGRPLRIDVGRDPLEAPVDAGHLQAQEILLRLIRLVGYTRRVELLTRPSHSRHAIDVAALDPRRQILIVIEVINVIEDVGAGQRSFSLKLGEAGAVAAGMGFPNARIAGCWAVVDNRRNRELIARYPEFFATRFPGSSAQWVRALTTGEEPPTDPGLIWVDTRHGRLIARRARGG